MLISNHHTWSRNVYVMGWPPLGSQQGGIPGQNIAGCRCMTHVNIVESLSRAFLAQDSYISILPFSISSLMQEAVTRTEH